LVAATGLAATEEVLAQCVTGAVTQSAAEPTGRGLA
jgi:hypothetical protein